MKIENIRKVRRLIEEMTECENNIECAQEALKLKRVTSVHVCNKNKSECVFRYIDQSSLNTLIEKSIEGNKRRIEGIKNLLLTL